MSGHCLVAMRPESFKPHYLHSSEENFRETNCYSDLVIELLHSLHLNPIACLGFTLAADFEGDQWTFGKPSHHDLQAMYGLRVEELSLYRPLIDQIVTQVERGAIPLLEADAYHLPDTAGIDYRTNHVKTTIGISAINTSAKTLHYFHNATFSVLQGEDFEGVLQPLIALQKGYLPPYCEIAKLNQLAHLNEQHLKILALQSAKFHFQKRPDINPITLHQQAMQVHQQMIVEGGLAAYHAYTFVALRQLGAAHQLGAHFLRWLEPDNRYLKDAIISFEAISSHAKMLVLKLARVANSGKLADTNQVFDDMANCWEMATQQLNTFFASK